MPFIFSAIGVLTHNDQILISPHVTMCGSHLTRLDLLLLKYSLTVINAELSTHMLIRAHPFSLLTPSRQVYDVHILQILRNAALKLAATEIHTHTHTHTLQHIHTPTHRNDPISRSVGIISACQLPHVLQL
jgi:hypothetical protein